MNLPPPLPHLRPKSSWPALVVSLAACPGLGQLMQRRWLVGGILTAFAFASGGWLIEAMIAGTIQNMRVSFATGHSDLIGYFRSLALPAKLFGLTWLLSSIDVLLAHWRLLRRSNS